jgi:predicted enzyme related to lactoylglutathione lyase
MVEHAPGTPSWLDLGSPDVEASRSFYESLFGWTSEAGAPEYGGYTTFYRDGKSVAAVGPLQSPEQPPVWTPYFATADAAATQAKVEEAGGKTLVPPMDVAPFGSMAIFTDSAGAAFGVWQPAEMKGADALYEGTGSANWFELSTRDLDGAKSFYPAVLGLSARQLDFPGGAYVLLEQDGKPYAGAMPMDPAQFPPEVPSYWGIYFEVDDVDAAVAKVTELGGSVVAPPMDMDPGRLAFLKDQFGATFAVIKPNPDFQP